MRVGSGVRSLITLLLGTQIAMLAGCVEPQRAEPQVPPPQLEFSQASGFRTVVVNETDGLKVLWHGPTGRAKYPPNGSVGLAAVSEAEFIMLWKDLGRPSPAPYIDFKRYLVLGAGEPSGVCAGTVVAVDVEPGGVLRTRGTPSPVNCSERRMQAAQIIAVPRRIAHDRVVFVPFEFQQAYAFKLPAK